MTVIGFSFQNQPLLFNFVADRSQRIRKNVFLSGLHAGPHPDCRLRVGRRHLALLLPGLSTLGQDTGLQAGTKSCLELLLPVSMSLCFVFV